MGAVFHSTLSQIGFLFFLMGIGWLLAKLNVFPKGASAVLAKLETSVFVPAWVMCVFMRSFTPYQLKAASKTLLISAGILSGSIFLALIFSRMCTREDYARKLCLYGLSFSNFGFMGTAVVNAVFPQVFSDYLLFTIPFWMMVCIWGIPSLLIPGGKKTAGDRLRALFHPTLVGMLIGILLGLTGWGLPGFISTAVTVAGDCMSSVAMLLTGITVAGVGFSDAFGKLNVWAVSLIRLLLLPVIGILVLLVLPLNYTVEVCIVVALAMPLGLNTIVIPASYGKNPGVGSSMALLSHLLSCFTIPLVFWLMERIL